MYFSGQTDDEARFAPSTSGVETNDAETRVGSERRRALNQAIALYPVYLYVDGGIGTWSFVRPNAMLSHQRVYENT